jgi:SlyX protein
MADDDLVSRIETLEIRLTEQEATIDDLNKVVLDQWKEIEHLRHLVSRFEDRLAEAQASVGLVPAPEPPPPHY